MGGPAASVHRRRLVGGGVVQHDVHGVLDGNFLVDFLEELLELNRPMPSVQRADHRTRGNVQRGVGAGGACSDVVVTGSGRSAGQHRQHRRGAVQRLDLAIRCYHLPRSGGTSASVSPAAPPPTRAAAGIFPAAGCKRIPPTRPTSAQTRRMKAVRRLINGGVVGIVETPLAIGGTSSSRRAPSMRASSDAETRTSAWGRGRRRSRIQGLRPIVAHQLGAPGVTFRQSREAT